MVCQWFDIKTSGTVSPGLASKPVASDFLVWASKSPRWFLGLSLKTKWDMVCRLRYKTDGRMKMARGTR
jgi:hypothetical protein